MVVLCKHESKLFLVVYQVHRFSAARCVRLIRPRGLAQPEAGHSRHIRVPSMYVDKPRMCCDRKGGRITKDVRILCESTFRM